LKFISARVQNHREAKTLTELEINRITQVISQFIPQISGPLAHGVNGVVQLSRRDLTGIGHVLGQEVLESLAD